MEKKTKFTYVLHLAGSTPEKPNTMLVAADSLLEVANYVGRDIDVVQIVRLPDNVIIL